MSKSENPNFDLPLPIEDPSPQTLPLLQRVSALGPTLQALNMKRFLPAAVYAGVNILDAISTNVVLRSGGTEINPVMNQFIHYLGPDGSYVGKAIIAAPFGYLLYKSKTQFRYVNIGLGLISLLNVSQYILHLTK